jgi:hypothetical protein
MRTLCVRAGCRLLLGREKVEEEAAAVLAMCRGQPPQFLLSCRQSLLQRLDVLGCRINGDAAGVDGKAYGRARHQQVVAVAVHAAHVVACSVKPGNWVFFLRHDFKAFVGLDAAERAERARHGLDRIERSGLHFAEQRGILRKLFVMADVAEVVVGFNRLLDAFGIHAGGFRETFERVGLESPAGFLRIGEFFIEFRELRADRHHHADAEIDAVVDHMIERLLIVNDVHRAADALKRVAGERPLQHDLFVAEAVSLRGEPKERLLGGGAHMIGGGNAAGTRTVGGLDFGAFLAAADVPGHADAVARLAGLRKAVGVREAQVFLCHLAVREEAARSDDRGLGVHGDLVAGLIGRFDAGHASVVSDELGAPRFEKQRLTLLLVLLLEEVDPAGAAALIDVPRVKAVRVVREELFEHYAVFLHPVDRVGRLVDEGPDHFGVAAPVAVVHDFLERFVLGECIVPIVLHLRLDGENAFGELTRAADRCGFLERDHLEAFFGSGPRGRCAGCAGADDDDVGRVGLIGRKGRREGQRHGSAEKRHFHCLAHNSLLFRISFEGFVPPEHEASIAAKGRAVCSRGYILGKVPI